ncbi:MAG: ABC transporter ATP-binding protein [Planctomycetota bacterium]
MHESDATVRFDAVVKTFVDPERGAVRALDGVDCRMGDGIHVLLGANGAGKSTMLRLLVGLLLPDEGSVVVGGHDTRTAGDAVRSRLGFLSLGTQLYPRLTGREMLRYAGRFHGLDGAALEARIGVMDTTFALSAFLDQRCDAMSTGQRQRINLARTLLADPDLLVLDEPTTGLDLLAAARMVAAVAEMRRPRRCIVFCTHLLHEAETLADHVLVMRDGRLVFDGPPALLGQGASFARAVSDLVGPPATESA